MTDLIWTLVFIQVAMGGFDTLYHHELTERLAWRPSQAGELRLHGVRNLAYAVMFLALGWSRPQGLAAAALIVLMLAELVVTLWDFVEEDRTRKLPASERVTHTLLTLNYGVVLALVVPLLAGWTTLPTTVTLTFHGVWSGLCALAAAGVVVFGLRDLAAAGRTNRIVASDPVPLVAALPPRQAVLITGATGLIGRRLVAALVGAGHDVTVLTRARANAAVLPAPIRIVTDLDQLPDETRIDAVVNLAGEPIAEGLWTPAKRRQIIDSRVETTRAVVALIGRLRQRPKVLVNGSAIGWYGLWGDETLDETARGRDCFSRTVCARWETAAEAAEALGVRVVRLRIGIVLAIEGGALSRMLTPFEFGLGGPFGAGRHWMSWIHLDDLVRLIAHAVATPGLKGAVNGTAPEPERNLAFARALGGALHRPAVLSAPAAPLRLALGAFADELLLEGQKVIPAAALASGFRFIYPALDEALADIVGARRTKSRTAVARLAQALPGSFPR
ncbi:MULTISPECIES: TIGR01777 family oxidoreductase [unclassified Caulobacter]|uniref:TIGR01777 family oxidoreductase n=1 Tax=unclassified Caulobacter TaxID=2648921 RepID=UPI0006F254C7|nr:MULTISPECIES: TIGR01777 family oxidoreductase [unclassified Caulobacter]KQV57418.1 SulA-family protein [Caulobacter sp. Root342]KQV66990.1 SulA-family protein [Caulobacter sp. Root343]